MPDPMDDCYYGDLFSSMGVALITTDTSLRVRFVNAAAQQMFSRSAEELAGLPASCIVPEEHRESAERMLRRTLERQEPTEMEFCVELGRGRERCVAVTLSPIRRAAGECDGISICSREVTRRISLERAWGDAARMAALRAMAGGVAHHFNNLLGGLVTSIDFAQQSDDPRMLRRTLTTASEALNRGNELTRRLQAFAEGDRIGGDSEVVTKTLAAFVEALTPGLLQRGVQLSTAIEPVEAVFPVRSVLTILEGLIANAVEAMPQGGVLRLEFAKSDEGKHLILRISDSGPGIEQDLLPRLCEPFFTTKVAEHVGEPIHTGLGLAVVYGVVRGLQGTLDFDCPASGGTICTVQIPLQMPPNQ